MGFMYFVILLIQKLVPLYLIFVLYMNRSVHEGILVASAVMGVVVGCLGGLRVGSFRGMLAYSSLIHRSWLTLIVIMSSRMFLYYLFMYSMSLALVTMF